MAVDRGRALARRSRQIVKDNLYRSARDHDRNAFVRRRDPHDVKDLRFVQTPRGTQR
jgi:hypothetical protein